MAGSIFGLFVSSLAFSSLYFFFWMRRTGNTNTTTKQALLYNEMRLACQRSLIRVGNECEHEQIQAVTSNDRQTSNSREHVSISHMPEHVENKRYNLVAKQALLKWIISK